MRIRAFSFAVGLILVSSVLPLAEGSCPGSTPGLHTRIPLSQLAYAQGEVLVKFKRGTGTGLMDEIKGSAGCRLNHRSVGPEGNRQDIQVVRLKKGIDVREAVNDLQRSGAVVFAEPNYILRPLYTPGDPGFPDQWGLHNTGQELNGKIGKPDADIDAPEAWDIEKGNTNPVTVAVLDSGIDFDHPEFASRIWQNPDEVPGNKVDDDGNGYVDDINGYNWAGVSQTCFYYLSGGNPFFMSRSFGESASTRRFAQSFTGTGQELTHLGVLLDKVGSPDKNITVAVRDELDGPDVASLTISPADVGTWLDDVYKELSSPVTLESGATYYLVFETENEDIANYYQIYENQGSTNGDVYQGGQEYHDDGLGWHPSVTDDFYFKTNPNAYPLDDNGHGTFVSGILGAKSNDQGVAGISFGAKIMPLKVMDASGVPSAALHVSEVVEALHYAADNGARVVSMSLGTYFQSSALQEAVNYAHGKGTVLAAAAGNDGNSSILYPACCENVLGAGATTNQDEKASFSNYNSGVDVTAPGEYVYSTMNSGTYGFGSGTSAATPMVAGLAALVVSRSPSLTASQVEQEIMKNAEDLGAPGRDDLFGYGRINAYRTLRSLTSAPHIDAIGPDSGPVGTEVTLVGSHFGASSEYSGVSFGGTTASVYTSWGGSRIKCRVPEGVSGTVQVRVTTSSGSSNTRDFTVTRPEVTTSPTWYLAEGSTAYGFSTYITVENPNDSDVTAELTYMTKSGPVEGPPVQLPPESQATVNPQDRLGSQDFSTRVSCREGKTIAVDRTMTWTGTGALSGEAHSSIGVTSPEKTWYLPEGSSAWGFECWLLIQNPNDTEAVCNVTYMIEGENARTFEKRIPANSRNSFSIERDIGNKDASIKVESKLPVIPERAMYRNSRREGHDSIGTSRAGKTSYLAEGTTAYGFTTYVLIQNPNEKENEVTVTYMTSSGPRTHPEGPIRMPPNSRKTIRVNDVPGLENTDFSTAVKGTCAVIAERAMYWDNGTGEACHDSIGLMETHNNFYLPDGQTGGDYETWTLIQNPNPADVKVEITYLTPTGKGNATREENVPAYSRRTFELGKHGGITGRASIMVRSLSEGKNIMVERAMYWNSRGAGTNTIGGYSD